MITPELIDRAIQKIGDHGAGYLYFFQHLTSPQWLMPLSKKGFFKNPPSPSREGNYISFPPWVESQYLARVAAQSPEAVADIILRMEHTNNVRVHRDILEATTEMPAPIAARLATKIAEILQNTSSLFVEKFVVTLIQQLAAANEKHAALTLCKTALQFFPDPDSFEKALARKEPDGALWNRLQPKTRWQTHEYKEILNEAVRRVIEIAPVDILRLACETLDAAIRFSYWEDELTAIAGNDGSVSWRPSIEQSDQNSDYFHKSLLVPIIRDASQTLVAAAPENFATVEEILSHFSWDIYKRILIHLCRLFPTAAGHERISRLLLDRELFDNYRFQHEWMLLLSEQFKELGSSEQSIILGWINNEFDAESRRRFHTQQYGSEPSAELLDGWKKRWQRDKLSFIASATPDLQRRYNELVAEVGTPDHPSFPIWSTGVRSGSPSPKTAQEIVELLPTDLFKFLRDWEPSEDWLGPKVEGLACALRIAVKDKPGQFTSAIEEIKTLRDEYITAILQGFDNAVSERKQIDWIPVLQLCEWILFRPTTYNERSFGAENSTSSWTKLEIIRLLMAGLKPTGTEIPLSCRTHVWKTLLALTDAEIPTLEYEEKYASKGKYGTLSINTARGEAMHGLFTYADWVRRLTNAGDHNPASEILDPLAIHLDITKEPTLTVRSVYSQHLAWLFHFHPVWFKSNLERIFPRDEAFSQYRDVAWETYVTFCNAWLPLFKLLKPEYERAVSRLKRRRDPGEDYDLLHPDDALGQHLITIYWLGELSIDEPSSLISRFFDRATDETRAHVIDYAGRSIWNSEGPIPIEVIHRLQHLFDVRLTKAELQQTNTSYRRELGAFGVWVYSRKFEPIWTLRALLRTLKLTPDRERLAGYLLEPLSQLSVEFPLEAIQCFQSFVLSSKELPFLERDEVKQVLRNAQQSGGEASRIADELQEFLIRNGLFEFRNLA